MLDRKVIAKMIDHALLIPNMSRSEVDEGCSIALKYETAAVCVRGYDVKYCAEKLKGSGVLVCSVIGFPHGISTTKVKMYETEDALANGAEEIDLVIPIGLIKSGMYDYLKDELVAVKGICDKASVPLKIIFENAFLKKDEIIECCKVCNDLGVAFIKSSTGFAPTGAVLDELKIMKDNINDSIEIKASGGIRTLDQLLEYYEMGVTRFGTSSTVKILEEAKIKGA